MVRKFLLFFIVIKISSGIYAQSNIEGEYYLHGVMEVASGFLIKPDSTFQFFFSYGALDREGLGKWTVKGNQLILNSRPKPLHDFAVIKSEIVDNDFTTIKIVDSNKNFLRYVYVSLKFSDTTIEEKTDEDGELKINRKGAENISLVFEFSPEKISNFKVDKGHNYYEFRIEPFITEVFFENFHLQVETNKLTGRHPLLDEKEYTYEKDK